MVGHLIRAAIEFVVGQTLFSVDEGGRVRALADPGLEDRLMEASVEWEISSRFVPCGRDLLLFHCGKEASIGLTAGLARIRKCE